MPTPQKEFDAVEMSRRVKAELNRELAGFTREKLLEYLNAPVLRRRVALGSVGEAPDEHALVREEPPSA